MLQMKGYSAERELIDTESLIRNSSVDHTPRGIAASSETEIVLRFTHTISCRCWLVLKPSSDDKEPTPAFALTDVILARTQV